MKISNEIFKILAEICLLCIILKWSTGSTSSLYQTTENVAKTFYNDLRVNRLKTSLLKP